MPIPSLRAAKEISSASENKTFTIACVSCRKPMWTVKLYEKYGTRWKFDAIPFDGVPPYSEYWEKDQKTAKRNDCPFCGENYLKAIMAPGLKPVARPFVVEWDT